MGKKRQEKVMMMMLMVMMMLMMMMMILSTRMEMITIRISIKKQFENLLQRACNKEN